MVLIAGGWLVMLGDGGALSITTHNAGVLIVLSEHHSLVLQGVGLVALNH